MLKEASGALALAAAAVFGYPSSMDGNPIPPHSEIQRQDEEILRELRAIRRLLEGLVPQTPPGAPQAPRRTRLTTLEGHVLGRRDAPLTMVEFIDLQCPFCRQFAVTTFVQLKERWIDTGRLQYISRDLPLDFHAQAMNAARAARCSGEQGQFWEMRLALVRNADLLSAEYILQTAEDLKLDVKALELCARSERHDQDIRQDIDEAARAGITGTPTFVIGRTHEGPGFEGFLIVGAVSYAVLDASLSALLQTSSK